MAAHVPAPRTGLCPDGSAGAYHLLIGGGDQIYCDSVWTDVLRLRQLDTWAKRRDAKVSPTLVRDLEKHFAHLYLRWKDSWFHEMHARVPGIYTWDDHDIFDGWGSYDDELQACPVFQAIFSTARCAFQLFQLGGGPGTPGSLCLAPQGHFLQGLRLDGQLDVLALDLRSERTDEQVMDPNAQWRDVHAFLTARAAAPPPAPLPARHLLVVSSIPLVYLNFASTEKFLDWFPWRQDLEDDLRDQWESSAHQEERARLIMTLLDHAAATGTRITVLSGDVHVGARGRIVSRRPAHLIGPEPEAVMHQLTSSAIVFPPPSALALAGMRAVSGEGPSPRWRSRRSRPRSSLGADYFLLGQRNWLSIENGTGDKHELWVRWLTEDGDVSRPFHLSLPAVGTRPSRHGHHARRGIACALERSLSASWRCSRRRAVVLFDKFTCVDSCEPGQVDSATALDKAPAWVPGSPVRATKPTTGCVAGDGAHYLDRLCVVADVRGIPRWTSRR